MYCQNCGKEIADNAHFCQYCGQEIGQTPKKEVVKNNINKDEINKNKKIPVWFWILILVIGYAISTNEDIHTPQLPKDLKCIEHKNLCIATTDVIYDYTSVKSKTSTYPAYNKEWYNGWAAAQNACKAWGGRLPYIEEFPIIIDAFNEHKIKLEEYKTYLSGTQINTYRIWAYSVGPYGGRISIEKSGDHHITGHYDTNPVYTWPARCVKNLK